MTEENTSIFAAEETEKQKKIAKRALLTMTSATHSAVKILTSARSLFAGNGFPSDTTEAEKAVLKESLVSLSSSVKKARASEAKLGLETPEKKKQRKEQKQKIHTEFKKAKAAMESKIAEEKDPIKLQKDEVEAELKRIKQEYETQKDLLNQRKKTLTQKYKELSEKAKRQQNAVVNARKKALEEIAKQSAPPATEADIQEAAHVFHHLQKDINRAKGGLMTVFSDPEEKETLQNILQGKFVIEESLPAPAPKEKSQENVNQEVTQKQEASSSTAP